MTRSKCSASFPLLANTFASAVAFASGVNQALIVQFVRWASHRKLLLLLFHYQDVLPRLAQCFRFKL